jgi:hypothetical protein
VFSNPLATLPSKPFQAISASIAASMIRSIVAVMPVLRLMGGSWTPYVSGKLVRVEWNRLNFRFVVSVFPMYVTTAGEST